MKRTLKGIRTDLSLTQEEMAKKLGMGIQTWRNKEAYVSELTATELMKICNMTNLRPEEIKLTA